MLMYRIITGIIGFGIIAAVVYFSIQNHKRVMNNKKESEKNKENDNKKK